MKILLTIYTPWCIIITVRRGKEVAPEMQIVITIARHRLTITLSKIKKKSPTQKPTQSNSQSIVIINKK
jgi:hypothetical protein